MVRLSSRADGLHANCLSTLASHYLHFAWLELHPPHDMIGRASPNPSQGGGFCAYALALAVNEQLHLVGIVVIAPHVNLLTFEPVPVGEEMQHGRVRPLALVHVIHILRLTTEVDDAKVAAAGWEAIGCGFTDVVEARPDKLSTAIRRMLHHVPVLFVRRTPRGMHVVVGRTHETGVGIGQPPLLRRLADGVAGHHVVACRLQG